MNKECEYFSLTMLSLRHGNRIVLSCPILNSRNAIFSNHFDHNKYVYDYLRFTHIRAGT